ncbi:Uncharacterised protein [Mycobacteroides abscessus subsp. massiliense]|nr:Uncharacterised protein [Mycobacteroides abscessus subsp. massiliense]
MLAAGHHSFHGHGYHHQTDPVLHAVRHVADSPVAAARTRQARRYCRGNRLPLQRGSAPGTRNFRGDNDFRRSRRHHVRGVLAAHAHRPLHHPVSRVQGEDGLLDHRPAARRRALHRPRPRSVGIRQRRSPARRLVSALPAPDRATVGSAGRH